MSAVIEARDVHVSFGDKHVLRENVREVALRAGDMLVLHSIWQDLAQAAGGRDFVTVTGPTAHVAIQGRSYVPRCLKVSKNTQVTPASMLR